MKKIYKLLTGIFLCLTALVIFHPNHPSKWNSISINDTYNKVETILGPPVNIETSDIKGHVYIKHTYFGWYRMNIHRFNNETVQGVDIHFYLGIKNYYKRININTIVSEEYISLKKTNSTFN